MHPYINIAGEMISMRTTMINVGTVVGIVFALVLLYIRYRKERPVWKMLLYYVALPTLIIPAVTLTVGALCGKIARGLTHPLPEGSLADKISFLCHYSGTHFIGVVFACFFILPVIYRIIYREKSGEISSVIAFYFIIQHFFGRLGCFLNGCCYGIPMKKGLLSVKFPDNILEYRVFPSQLFEMLCMLIIFVLQIILYKKGKRIFCFTVAAFSFSILLSEFWISKYGLVSYMNLTPIQFIAIFLLLCTGIVLLIQKTKGSKKKITKGVSLFLVLCLCGTKTVHAAEVPSERNDSGLLRSWYLDSIGCLDMWEVLARQDMLPGEGVVVATIDTGLASNASTLLGARWCNEVELNGEEGVDDDGNGYVDDIYGLNLANEYPDMSDSNGHGTQMAGVIAMQPGDGGGVGIAYGAKIMPIKVSTSTNFDEDTVIEAIEYAVKMKADVINMSFATYRNSPKLEAAVREASKSCVMVAAAGNESYATEGEIDEETLEKDGYDCGDAYPAAWDCCIGVMSYDTNESLASFSNWDQSPEDARKYNVIAPGKDIYTVTKGGTYKTVSGTSLSTAIVSASVAVLKGLTKDQYSAPELTELFLSLMKDKVAFTYRENTFHFPKLSFDGIMSYISDQSGEKPGDGGQGESGDQTESGDQPGSSEQTGSEKQPESGDQTGSEKQPETGTQNGTGSGSLEEQPQIVPVEPGSPTGSEKDDTSTDIVKMKSPALGKITQNRKKLVVRIKNFQASGSLTLKVRQTIKKKNGKKKKLVDTVRIKKNKAVILKKKLQKKGFQNGKVSLRLIWSKADKGTAKTKQYRLNMK